MSKLTPSQVKLCVQIAEILTRIYGETLTDDDLDMKMAMEVVIKLNLCINKNIC